MTRSELIAVLRRHANEAGILAVATQVLETLPAPSDDEVLAIAWALDSARRWARGETGIEEALAASSAAWHAELAADESRDAVDDASMAASAASVLDDDFGASAVYGAAYCARYVDPDEAYGELAARLPTKGGWVWRDGRPTSERPAPSGWGPWHQGRLIARAGGYLWRESEGRFVDRAELTTEEAVDLDEIEERCG